MPVDPSIRYAFRNVVITLEDIQEKLAGDGLTVYDNNDLAAEIRNAQQLDRGEYRERALRAESRLEALGGNEQGILIRQLDRIRQLEAHIAVLRVAERRTESNANETDQAWETRAKEWKARAERLVLRLRTAHERIEEMQAEASKDYDELLRLTAAFEASEARIRELEGSRP